MRQGIVVTYLLCTLLLFFAPAGFTAPLEVFVSIPPQKWLGDRLGGDRVITHVLVANGRDPHTFEPSPKQIKALSRSKIYFTIGLEFEKQIVQKLDQAVTGLLLVDSTRAISRISMVEERHENEQDDHAHEGSDPHVWLSPVNLQSMAKVMAEAMAAADPDNRLFYEQNLKRLHAELLQLHESIHRKLAGLKGASFYVFHPSFGYFAKEYSLRQQAVEIAGKSPSPRQLSALISMARKEGIRIIFVQPQFDSKSAQTVARAIGGIVEPLDPLAEDVTGNLNIIATKIRSALDGRDGEKN